jgi:galactokinase
MTTEQLEALQEALKTATPKTAEPEVIYRRMRHCLMENQRVYKATDALKSGNLQELGQLMNASHESLKTDYETTGIELDTLNQEANKIAGCLGARVTGAGFGGCAIALVHKDSIPAFIDTVGAAYKEKIGYEATFFQCATGSGAGPLA